MRRQLMVILLVGVLAGCTQEPDPRGVGRDEVLLQVMASGRADTRPDEARFTAGVQTIAGSAAAASAGNNEAMNKVIAALEALGVKRDDVQTRQITLSRIDYGADKGRFQANNMVEVRMRDIDKAGAAIAATTEAGANVLSGPNMAVADPEAANRSAYAQAYKAARARADTYAEAAGMKVARVLAIRDTGMEQGPSPYYDAVTESAAAAPQVAAPPLRPGMNASQVQVHADFALAAK
ncbi:MAG: SIMPL domain-containing protein [Sphingosinicella sp.]|nr:SIMPL domain-containing protein [Sphingosinicella sp.]